jgi:hypothetical protein
LQPTVEDAEDDGEDNEIREDVTVIWQENRHTGSKSLSSKEIARADRGEKSDEELASEGLEESDASDHTDDTFLPSDSISNVGITTETCPALDIRTPQPLPLATKKTSRPEGKTADPPPNLHQCDSNEGPPPPPPPLQGKSGDAPRAICGGMPVDGGRNFTYEFSTGEGGGFSFSNPESIFSEFLRGQGNNYPLTIMKTKIRPDASRPEPRPTKPLGNTLSVKIENDTSHKKGHNQQKITIRVLYEVRNPTMS